jgi:3-oxoadipate enol-lactonase
LDLRDRALISVARDASDKGRLTEALRRASACGVTQGELVALCEELGLSPPTELLSPIVLVPQTTAIRDQEFSIVRSGSGPPLVVLHSLGLDWRVSRDLFPQLYTTAEIVAYDLRSHGTSSAPPGTFSLERCAEDVIDLLDKLEISRAHLAGCSLGGAIAQIAALRAPKRIESLILVCTMAQAKSDLYLQRAEAAESCGTTRPQIAPTLRRWFSDQALTESPWYVRYARERVRRASVAQWSCWWRRFAELNILGDLRRLDVPTTLIAAVGDRSTPPEEMKQMADVIPAAELEVIPQGSHLIPFENPSAVAAHIKAHLKRVGAIPASALDDAAKDTQPRQRNQKEPML